MSRLLRLSLLLLFPLLLGTVVAGQDRPPEGLPDPKDAKLLQVLRESLVNIPELKEVRVLAAVVRPGDVVEIAGTVPKGALRAKVGEEAVKVLANAVQNKDLPGPYKGVDTAGLIDASEPVERQVQHYLNARLVGPARKVQGRITQVAVGPEGIVLRGTVSKEEMRASLEAEAGPLLAEARRIGLIPLLPGPLLRIDASGLRSAPTEVFGILETAFQESPPLAGFRLVHAELTPGGLLELAGLSATEEQKDVARAVAVVALEKAIADGVLPGAKLERIDLRKVLVGSSAVDELLVIESLAPSLATRLVRAAVYSPATGELCLAGIVESEAARQQVARDLERLPLLRRVDVSGVLIRQGEARPGEPTGTLVDAFDALGRNDTRAMLEAATASARNAAPGSAASVNAWYMRAAAHFLQGQRQDAVGDLRVARGLSEHTIGAEGYYRTLERFQGPTRIGLSNLLREGPRAAVFGSR